MPNKRATSQGPSDSRLVPKRPRASPDDPSKNRKVYRRGSGRSSSIPFSRIPTSATQHRRRFNRNRLTGRLPYDPVKDEAGRVTKPVRTTASTPSSHLLASIDSFKPTASLRSGSLSTDYTHMPSPAFPGPLDSFRNTLPQPGLAYPPGGDGPQSSNQTQNVAPAQSWMDIVSHRLPVGGPSSFLQGLRDGELEPGFTSIPIAPTPLRNNLVGTAGVGIGRTNPFSLHVVARSPGGRQKDLFDLIGPSRLTEMAGVSKEEECFVLPPLPIHRVQDVSHEEGDGTEREPFGLFEKSLNMMVHSASLGPLAFRSPIHSPPFGPIAHREPHEPRPVPPHHPTMIPIHDQDHGRWRCPAVGCFKSYTVQQSCQTHIDYASRDERRLHEYEHCRHWPINEFVYP